MPRTITTKPAKWRYQCPRRHTNWFPIDGVFRCRSCARLRDAGKDVSPEFSELVDSKTGERVSREEIDLQGAVA